MSNVITLNNVVAQLALNANLSESESREFINGFFNLIESTLASGESVTVKGLGTFEAVEGEVRFVGDETFRSRCNEPFEMFAPMVLDDDMEPVLATTTTTTTTITTIETIETIETTETTETEAPTGAGLSTKSLSKKDLSPGNNPTTTEASEPDIPPIPPVIPPIPPIIPPIPKKKPERPGPPPFCAASFAEKVNAEEQPIEIIVEEEPAAEYESAEDYGYFDDQAEEVPRRRGMRVWLAVVLIVTAFLIGLFAGILLTVNVLPDMPFLKF